MEMRETLIVVFIAETDPDNVYQVTIFKYFDNLFGIYLMFI